MATTLDANAIGRIWASARLRERLPDNLSLNIRDVTNTLDHRTYRVRFVVERKDGGKMLLQHPEFDQQDFKELRPGLTFRLPDEELARLVLFLS